MPTFAYGSRTVGSHDLPEIEIVPCIAVVVMGLAGRSTERRSRHEGEHVGGQNTYEHV